MIRNTRAAHIRNNYRFARRPCGKTNYRKYRRDFEKRSIARIFYETGSPDLGAHVFRKWVQTKLFDYQRYQARHISCRSGRIEAPLTVADNRTAGPEARRIMLALLTSEASRSERNRHVFPLRAKKSIRHRRYSIYSGRAKRDDRPTRTEDPE